jgi:hypothetical protein
MSAGAGASVSAGASRTALAVADKFKYLGVELHGSKDIRATVGHRHRSGSGSGRGSDCTRGSRWATRGWWGPYAQL